MLVSAYYMFTIVICYPIYKLLKDMEIILKIFLCFFNKYYSVLHLLKISKY